MGKLEEARALSAMKETEGWRIVEDWLKSSKDIALTGMMSPKKSDQWHHFTEYRGAYNTVNKLLAVIEQKIEAGKEENKNG